MNSLRVITNNVPRDIVYGYELTDKERKEFDYIDFSTDDGVFHQFFRYKGWTYDLEEFERWDNPNSPTVGTGWDGMSADTFFSGILIRYIEDFERVVVGRYYT